jgi:outer membrane protein assembly factor BamB
MPSPGSRRNWRRRGLVAVAVVLLALGGAVAFVLLHAPGNVSHPNLSFTDTTATKPGRHHRPVVDNSLWPRYGYNAARTRLFPAPADLKPPFRTAWTFNDGALLEFPPVLYQKTLYFIDDNGSVTALDKDNGKVLWKRKVGTLAAASPAVGVNEKLIYVPTLATHGSSPGAGRMVALSMKTGRVIWKHDLAAGSESSPLEWHKQLYFGDQGGNVYSMNARTGHVNWTYHASAAVKGGPALASGILYFGDYSGRAYALRAGNGHPLWAVSTSGTHFGFGSGNFYSTPAVAFGRVYLGNTDGRVYSFAARTGQLAWATATGSYVYGSPAVADVKGLGPTVYVGSYDGHMYAFNAQSGAVRWSHNAQGKISGSATIIDNVVYYSDLGTKTTAGLDARTGRQVFSYGNGAFNPVIADSKALYMIGYTTIAQMLPKGGRTTHHPARHHRSRAHAHKRRHGKHEAKPRVPRKRHAARTRRTHRRTSQHHRRRHKRHSHTSR